MLYFSVSYKFGILAMVSGLLGVPLGSFIAQALRPQYNSIDPKICAIGLLSSTPFVYFALMTAGTNTILCYISIFLGELFLNLTWALVADIVLVSYVYLYHKFIFQFIIFVRTDNYGGRNRWFVIGRSIEPIFKKTIP